MTPSTNFGRFPSSRYLLSIGGGGKEGEGDTGVPIGDDGSGIGGLELDGIAGRSTKAIDELFPVTLEDSRTGRQYWHEPASIAQAAAKELFERCEHSCHALCLVSGTTTDCTVQIVVSKSDVRKRCA